MGANLKIILAVSGMLIGGGIGYGSLQAQTNTNKEVTKENKQEIKASQQINLEQTVALTELGVTLKGVSKVLDKVVDKLDK